MLCKTIISMSILVLVASEPDLVVNSKHGKIEGAIHEVDSFSCDTFLGVPYAQPPIKENRFKKPESLIETAISELGLILVAQKMPKRCMQHLEHREELFGNDPESEDCLYLNVIRPSKQSKKPLPVMVYIHGGALKSGSIGQYGIDGVCRNFASKDVIIVMVQYRLGVFGFLSTGDNEARGNWGLWDQVEALKWVQKNIAAFGGDPSSVTIFGESAGALSVSALTSSDLTQKLYHRSIQMSGSLVSSSFMSEDLSNVAQILAEYSCNLIKPSSKEIMKCLRSLTAETLMENGARIFEHGYQDPNAPKPSTGVLPWVPVKDGLLIKYNGANLHKAANSKSAMIGTTEQELGWFVQPPLYMEKVWKFAATALSEKLLSWPIVDAIFGMGFSSMGQKQQNSMLLTLGRHVYFNSRDVEKNKTLMMEQYINLLSDVWFNVPSVFDAQARKAAGAKVYMYNFDYYCKNIFPENHKFKSSQHSFELFLLFEMSFNKLNCGNLDANDREVAQLMANAFTNFAKNGDPNPVTISTKWPLWHSTQESFNYRFGLLPTVDHTFHLERMEYWTQLVPQLLKHDEL